MDATNNTADHTRITVHVDPSEEMVALDERIEMVALDERMAKTTERLEADYSTSRLGSKIRRFPEGLRGIGGDEERYIVPSLVAVGPYHHGLPHLRKMEEVKLAAAHYLCRGAHSAVDGVYKKVLSVAGAARSCYDAADPSVAGLGDDEFADMMFLDGCFLMEYMCRETTTPVFENRMTLSTGPSILKDIFLLENQIPWLVLEALMEFIPVQTAGSGSREVKNANTKVREAIAGLGERFFPKKPKKKCSWPWPRSRCPETDGKSRGYEASYKPPHILGLLRHTQICRAPRDVVNYRGISSSLYSSAVELAQMGVVLSASTAAWFGDMSVSGGPLMGKMSLSPVCLNEVTACWLVNMAALEASTAVSANADGFVVSSFLSVFAMLMARKEDVHELRARRLLQSNLSNSQTLGFFKGLGQNLGFGGRYFAAMEQIDAYKRHRPVRIAIHKFVHNNYRTIAAILSIAGVLVGIFKTLLSLKCPSSKLSS